MVKLGLQNEYTILKVHLIRQRKEQVYSCENHECNSFKTYQKDKKIMKKNLWLGTKGLISLGCSEIGIQIYKGMDTGQWSIIMLLFFYF